MAGIDGIDGYMVGILALGVVATILFGCLRIADTLRKRKRKDK